MLVILYFFIKGYSAVTVEITASVLEFTDLISEILLEIVIVSPRISFVSRTTGTTFYWTGFISKILAVEVKVL